MVSVYELTGADVFDAISWAEGNVTGDQTYTLFLCHRNADDQLGLIRLAGVESNRTKPEEKYQAFPVRPLRGT
jgi:hypothetical protein